MGHPTRPPKEDSLQESGVALARMRYDALIVLLESFEVELARQVREDKRKLRPKMVLHGAEAIIHLQHMKEELRTMLRISIPHMKDELVDNPLLITL